MTERRAADRPEGAFSGFVHVEGLENSLCIANVLVRKACVGVAPGSAFGAEGDEKCDAHIRICYAQDVTLLETGSERLGKAVAGV